MRLLIDLSTSSYLALEDGAGKILASEVHQPPLRNEAVLNQLESLLEHVGQTWKDLSAIAVGMGPGSFTGIRVGIALAQGLAFAKALPIHPFNSLAALQSLYPRFALGIAAHGGRWYWRWPLEDLDRLLTTSELLEQYPKDQPFQIAVTGALPKDWSEKPAFEIDVQLENVLGNKLKTSLTNPPDFNQAWSQFLTFAFSQPAAPLGMVRPHYVQASAAEAKRRQSESEPVFRPWRESDLPALAELEMLCNSQPWSLAQWKDAYPKSTGKHSTQVEVMLLNGELMGYGLWQEVLDEGELQLLGIHPKWRRRGFGRLLVQQMLEKAEAHQIATLHLEVRASNQGARQLYTSLGFKETGMRREYYADPREDAVLMAIFLHQTTL